MRKIFLISCVNRKISHRAKARDLYVSPLFKFSLRYALSLRPNEVFVLSAKYGLVGLDQEIDPYNQTLKTMSAEARRTWAKRVVDQLAKVADLKRDEFIFLCGESYRQYLIPFVKHSQIPLKGLGIGRQLRYLKSHASYGRLL
jgi:hypothetical protein